MSKFERIRHIDLGQYIREKGERFVAEATRALEGKAKRNSPWRYGNLRRSIKGKHDRLEGEVEAHAGYSAYLEYGTGEHAEGGTGRKTPWTYLDEATGQWVTTTGSKPQPYMRPAADELVKQLNDIWRRL